MPPGSQARTRGHPSIECETLKVRTLTRFAKELVDRSLARAAMASGGSDVRTR